MKIINILKQSHQMGLLSTLKVLNVKQKFSFLIKVLTGKIFNEVKLTGGFRYPDKTFYIIRRNYSKVGLFSMYNTNAGHIRYALENDYIPVIDMQYYRNCYLDDNSLGEKNSWQYYFEQPFQYSLEEAYSSKNVILSSINPTEVRPNDCMSFFNDDDKELSTWRNIAAKHMVIKEEIWNEAKKRYEAGTNGKKCLGVSVRGTDYIVLEPPEHPIQPTIERVIEDVKRAISEFGYESIYLCTEDVNYIEKFKNTFGKACFINERKLIDYSDGSIIDKMMSESSDRYENGKEYLITILMLTMTDALLASRASGTVAAEMIGNGWDKQMIYNLGRYPKKG